MDVEPLQETLAELESSRNEFGEFFGDVFDQLQALSLELYARHRCLELSAQQNQQREAAAPGDEGHLQDLLNEVQEARAEMRGMREDTQRGWVELREALEKSSRADHDWQQRQVGLETELEAARRRAAELGEHLADQRRQAAEQQAQWAAELKRMRSLLEMLSNFMAPSPPAAVLAGGEPLAGSPPRHDPVLDTVMAQFETFQREAGRRAKRHG